jgi:hypothetical protein
MYVERQKHILITSHVLKVTFVGNSKANTMTYNSQENGVSRRQPLSLCNSIAISLPQNIHTHLKNNGSFTALTHL